MTMCGIAGIFHSNQNNRAIQKQTIQAMVDSLFHRGPDEDGYFHEKNVAMGQRRLSIIDLSTGTQPIYNEKRDICIVFNGEIYNYIELREELLKKGHQFRTSSDTEVIVHLYEEYGRDCVNYLNGQFAIAIWDAPKKKLFLARDRVGIRPLFYSMLEDGTLLFGSEMKALFQYPEVQARIDSEGLGQVFTLWVNVPPRTVFKGISELAPGESMEVTADGMDLKRFWKLRYPGEKEYEDRPLEYYTSRLQELIYDAVTLRLRADVPVAAYLSGGLDSSIITALVKKHHNNNLVTFSVAFDDPAYDERAYQEEMVKYLDTDHRMVVADYAKIGESFSDAVKFGEKPMVRTAPSPLFILSRMVRENNIKVVLTGEGADEMFGGYNIFKEDKIRRFWAESPESTVRPRLLLSLYPYIARDSRTDKFWQAFFKKGLTDTDHKYYSHLIRWNNTSQIKRFFKSEYKEAFDTERIYGELDAYLDPDMMRWHPLCRAQYLEKMLFMSGYLLSSQGDRMLMGNSVEGRFPFLDHNVIEFANTIPPKFKIKLLNEKYILKKTYEHLLPKRVVHRDKQPYRAPIYQCFTGEENLSGSMLESQKLEEFGYFNAPAVGKMLQRFKRSGGKNISARDDMALVGIVSLQLLHHFFV
ncbi:MAG: asparagine synthase (glutamine-hydrolyzing) [bacterium]|nr:asparagine synthase (glutamine-hydrolyzing) [bacterium]